MRKPRVRPFSLPPVSLLLIAALVLTWLPLAVSQAAAATFTVNSLAATPDASPGDGVCDDGAAHCTLAAAIGEALGEPTCDPVDIELAVTGEILGGQSYTIPPYFPCFHPSLRIVGPGEDAVTIADGFSMRGWVSGGALETLPIVSLRGVHVRGPITATFTTVVLADMSIDGDLTISCGAGRAGGGGGLVADSASLAIVSLSACVNLDITDSTLKSLYGRNLARANLVRARVSGGGLTITWDGISTGYTDILVQDSIIEDSPGAGVTVNGGRLVRTTIRGNRGGGLVHSGGAQAGALLSIEECTISGNSTPGNGGGLALAWPGESIVASTIVDNQADSDGDGLGDGGGIYTTGLVTISSSIIARNSDVGGEAPDCFGTLNSSKNLIGSGVGCSFHDSTGDLFNADPMLAPLADNGGPTPTHALLQGSPAIDAAGACSDTDQRGIARPQGAACDIGAFEFACGNGAVDPGEECDPGHPQDGDCCSADCRFQATGSLCADDAEPCTADDWSCPGRVDT